MLAELLEQAAISRHTLSRQDNARTYAPAAASGSTNTFIPTLLLHPFLFFFPYMYATSQIESKDHPPPSFSPNWTLIPGVQTSARVRNTVSHGCLLLELFCAPWRESGICVWSFLPSLLKGSGRRSGFRGAASPPSCCWWGGRDRRWRVTTCAHFWKLVPDEP